MIATPAEKFSACLKKCHGGFAPAVGGGSRIRTQIEEPELEDRHFCSPNANPQLGRACDENFLANSIVKTS
jgi:hypothetical protein